MDIIGLLDEGFGPALCSFLRLPVDRITAGYDNLGLGIDLKKLLKTLRSPHSRHDQVEDHQINSVSTLLVDLQGAFTIRGGHHGVPIRLKNLFAKVTKRIIIVHEKHGFMATA